MREALPLLVLLVLLVVGQTAAADPPTEAPPWLPRLLGNRVKMEGGGNEPGGFDNLRRAGATTFELGKVLGFDAKLRLAGGDRLPDPVTGLDPAATDGLNGPLWAGFSLTFTRRITRGWWLDIGFELNTTMADVVPNGAAPRDFFHEVLFRIALRF